MAGRSPSEERLEVVREPHRLNNCGVVPTDLPERCFHLGDGSSQSGLSDSGRLVPFAGGIHLLSKATLDGRLQRILLAASPLRQTSYAAPHVEGVSRQWRCAAPRRIDGHSGSVHDQPGKAGGQEGEGDGVGHAAIVQAVSRAETEFLLH